MADYEIDSNVFFANPVSATVTSHLAGLDGMNLTLDGGTTTTLAGETTINSNVDLKPVTSTATVTLAPVTTDSTVKTTSAIDLEPVAVDSCVRVELGPLPPTDVCTPYEQHWSFTLFGVELFAIGLTGTSRTQVRPTRHGPLVLDR